MARDISSTKQANISATVTRPVYLVEWQHSGVTEYLSCSGTIYYGDGSPIQAYTAGGLTITSMEDGKTATIVLPATATRISEIQYNTWRLGTCKITAILAAPGDTPVYAAADGDLMLDGVIEQSSFSGELITVIAKCKYYTGALVPRFTFNDVVTSLPAVGSTSTWEGENYSYEQWLKTTAALQKIVRPGVNPQVTGRLSTVQANSVVPLEQTGYKLLTAEGVNIPIVYGRASVPGFIFADGEYGGSKFIGVAWCMGEVFSVEKVFINDAVLPSSVTAKHYRGTTTQTVSPALQLYTSMSPLFSDDLILRTPAGNIGIAYSVFNIPSSAISGAPRFRAIIQGRLVEDPTSAATDPYADNVEWSYDFLTGVTDSGPNNYTLTLNGDAGIASPSIGLALDGTGDYATIPDGTAIGNSPFSLEIEFYTNTAAASPGTAETLICHGSTASPLSRSLQIDRLGDELLLYLSSDGSTWDICDGLSCGSIAGGGSPIVIGRVLVERVDNQISTYLDGATQTGVVTTASLYDSASVWELGACGGAQEWSGVIRSARLTIGAYRYGSPHSITNTPFSDTGNYTAGVVYSEKPALAWNDLAKNAVFGLGATTTGVQAAMEYGDTTMDSGAPRCRIGLAIQEPRLVESWLDILAMYANSLWFPEGSNLKIVADKKKDGTNGSGPELYTATSPEFGSPLPTVTTEAGVSYSVSVEVLTASTTSPLTGISVTFGGTTVITSVKTAGTHGALVTATGTSNTIEVVPDVGFNGTWANLSVKRTHRSITQWLPSTLRLQGTPEGDKPNAVLTKYKVPSDTSGAWSEMTFGIMNADATAGDPIVITTLDLPGVSRIEEASNKAIAKLFREDRKTIVSLVSTDEEVVCQPGDTVQVASTLRGVNAPVWVESNRMLSYGRHQITGMLYRDNQYPDTDYTDYTTGGRLIDGGYIEEATAGGTGTVPAYCSYDCAAIDTAITAQATNETLSILDTWHSGTLASFDWPFAGTTSPILDTEWRNYSSFIASPNIRGTWDGSGTGAGFRTGDLSGWTFDEQLGFCSEPNYVMNVQSFTGGVDAILIPSSMVDNTDYTFGMIFTGYNGTSTLSHELVRNSGKYYTMYRGAMVYLGVATVTAFVNVSSNGSGGHQIVLTVGNTPHIGTTAIDMGDVSGQWIMISGTVENNAFINGSNNAELHATVTVKITLQNGTTFSGSATGYNELIYAYAVTSIVESTHTLGTQPRFLYQAGTGASITVAKIAYNSGAGADLTALSRAFQSNFASYTGGAWCAI